LGVYRNHPEKNTHTYLLETTDGISVIMYLIAAASNTEEIPGSNVDLYPKIIKYFLSIKNITFVAHCLEFEISNIFGQNKHLEKFIYI
jgi:hypothetical protein